MHRIQHIGLEVITNGLAAPPERLEEDLQQLGTAQFWEPLESVFDGCQDPDSVWQIDKLSITVHVSGDGDWRRSLQDEITHAVGELLLARNKQIEVLPLTRQHFDNFLHYLTTGSLPWTAGVGQFTDNYLQHTFPAILRQYGEAWKAFISRNRSLTHLIGRRLSAQCPPILSECVLEILVPSMVTRIETLGPAWCEGVRKVLGPLAPAGLQQLFRETLMTEILESWQESMGWEQRTIRIGRRWLQVICNRCFPADPSARQSFLRALRTVGTTSAYPGDWLLLLHAVEPMVRAEPITRMDPAGQGVSEKGHGEGHRDARAGEPIPPAAPAGDPDQHPGDPGDDNPSIEVEGVEGVEYEVAQGGMVLLYPYMNTFLQGLGLLNDRSQFVAEEARQQAVYWWHYLAGGGMTPLEPDCVLGKVLCGMPIPAVLEYRPAWLESELQEGTNLLEAFIQHWTALKDCSVEALQQTFLLRRARLRDTGSNWLLQVDGSGVDILLDRLPFTLSQIYLPWLHKPIIVEWL